MSDIFRHFDVHDLINPHIGPTELALMDFSLNAMFDKVLQTCTVIIQPRNPEIAPKLPQLKLQVSTKTRAQRAYFIGGEATPD